MKPGPAELKEAFYRGDYKAVLALSLDAPKRRGALAPSDELGTLLGALAFLGRMSEAESLFDLHSQSLTSAQRIECRFFLGLGMTRQSRYAEARVCFGANRRELSRGRLASSAKARFFCFQGLAFYRYFCGRWKSAARAAQTAFQAALEDGFLYGRTLSSDLRGHIQIQTGEIGEGLKCLSDAEDLAQKLGNQGVAEAIRVSILGYEAQFGIDLKKSVSAIQRKLRQISVQDTYSRASLMLELARQLSLRARLSEAVTVLDDVSQIIYMNRNRRQEVSLNLRYAHVCYLSGESNRGLNFVQSAKRALDPAVDHALELAVMGQEFTLLRRLGMHELASQVLEKIRRKSVRFGGIVNRRALARIEGTSSGDASLDRVASILERPETERILKSGLLSLLYETRSIPVEKPHLVLEPENGALTFFDRGEVEHSTNLTPLSLAILEALTQGPQSKERLVERVWGNRYHPIRHDPAVYAAIVTLRKLLGSRAGWILTTESGYALDPRVTVLRSDLPVVHPAPDVRDSRLTDHSLFNHRQLRFMKGLKAQDFIGVKQYQKLFRISEVTAFRDLAALHRSGVVIRVGRARATRYGRPENETGAVQ